LSVGKFDCNVFLSEKIHEESSILGSPYISPSFVANCYLTRSWWDENLSEARREGFGESTVAPVHLPRQGLA
jgi:hypothetical protein